MRQVTVTEKYRAVNEGQMDKQEFVRQMRLAFPSLISQFNGYDDSVSILRTKGLLFEEKTMKHDVSDESIRRALDTEITVLGHDPVTCKDSEVIDKARTKAIANLSKDPLYYYNLLAKESSKVDKNDQPKETKRGALEKDTFNDMKKATLKERKENLVEGTRALVGYLAGDRLTTTYNHYDGYPSHLGKALEMHYNDDDKAKEIAMKGYITSIDGDTGEVESTHKEKPGKVILPDDKEQRAREIAEEVEKFGAEYGYVWDDNTNQWITIKNTGMRSMIDQILEKLDMVNVYSGDTMEGDIEEIDTSLDPYEDKKEIIRQVIELIKSSMPADNEEIKAFIKTHYDDIINLGDDEAILDEFQEFLSVNYPSASDFMDEKRVNEYSDYEPGTIAPEDLYYSDKHGKLVALDDVDDKYWDDLEDWLVVKKGDIIPDAMDETDAYDNDEETQAMIDKMRKDGKDADDFIDEKKGKDHDGDGDIDGDDYKSAKDKAIKKAMGKKSNVNEAVKNIITKVLEEQNINEAATNDLAKIAAEYGDFEGLKPAVIALENVVTEIESFYDKTRSKIQKIYNDLGEIRNEEGLKVGAFIAPSIENAFKRDLRPITKQQFHGGLDMPKVKRISQDDIDRGYTQMESPKTTVFTPVNEKKQIKSKK